MRKKIVAGNWKMNTIVRDGVALASSLNNALKHIELKNDTFVIIAPPFTHLSFISQVIDEKKIHLAAQNCSTEAKGAFTGEVSAEMIKMIGCTHVIIGHSERREYYKEDSEMLNKKVKQALVHNLTPIFCCGEKLEEREKKNHFNIVKDQISKALFTFSPDEFAQIIIAYEPVWAIGTGVTASKEQAQEMHAFIRNEVKLKYGEKIADELTILYGGSVNPGNAKTLFEQADVDGGLVGGASLNAADFSEIIKSI